MKRILMICNYFAPHNEIASVRITKFAKYLTEAGYQVEVIDEALKSPVKDSMLLKEVETIPVRHAEPGKAYLLLNRAYSRFLKPCHDRKYDDTASPKRRRKNPVTGGDEFVPFAVAFPVWGLLDHLLLIARQKSLFHSVKKYIRDNANRYDVCFSSYGEHFGHFCGLYLKKISPDIRWIADFRDPVHHVKFNSPYIKPYNTGFENRVYRQCSQITMDTETVIGLVPERYRHKAHTITNGFDACDRKPASLERPSKFSFCYTGRMYGGFQKVTCLFQAIADLIEAGEVDRNDVEFHYAGTGYQIFEKQSAAAGVSDRCIDHGYVSHEEATGLQANAMFLIVSAWEYRVQPMGVLPGKFYEYMTARKPIIALIDGDMPGEEFTNIIRQGNLGFAYNEYCRETDFEGLKAYLLKQYRHFKKGEPVEYAPDEAVLSQFDYRVLTKKLIAVIENG